MDQERLAKTANIHSALLLKLPGELRNAIHDYYTFHDYRTTQHVIICNSTIVPVSRQNDSKPRCDPLAHACRQTRREYLSLVKALVCDRPMSLRMIVTDFDFSQLIKFAQEYPSSIQRNLCIRLRITNGGWEPVNHLRQYDDLYKYDIDRRYPSSFKSICGSAFFTVFRTAKSLESTVAESYAPIYKARHIDPSTLGMTPSQATCTDTTSECSHSLKLTSGWQPSCVREGKPWWTLRRCRRRRRSC